MFRSSTSSHINISTSTCLDKYPAKQHAVRVAAALGVDEGLIYMPGEISSNYADSDQPRPFRQLRYFLYLSGVDESDCHLTYDISSDHLTLWLPPIDPKTVIWVGRGSTTEEALEKYDVDEARYTPSLSRHLASWTHHNPKAQIYLLHPNTPPPKSSALPSLSSSRLNTSALQPAINTCRAIKSSHEISLIKRANAITTLAHDSVLRNLPSFTNERQVAAHFLDVCLANGAKHQAYAIIAGSGPNAAVLHYAANDQDFGDRQLMCLDAGAEFEAYASDVTRTFPLEGRWPTDEAGRVYALVQEMQEACISRLAPGTRFVELQYLAHVIAIKGLLGMGVLRNGSVEEIYKAGTSMAFFPHGLGHHMGLEVHDVSAVPIQSSGVESGCGVVDEEIRHHLPGVKSTKDLVAASSHLTQPDVCRHPCQTSSAGLEAGMVITVEPGIYFNKYALDSIYYPSPVHSKYIDKDVVERYMGVGGVRIEDDVLITHGGYGIISSAAKGERALRMIRGEI